MRRIILASASERRKELLRQLIGTEFSIHISSYKEDIVEGLSPVELVMHHSVEKAVDVSHNCSDGIIIAADTVIVCKNEILGKPVDDYHARAMLRRISGQRIQAVSGLTVMNASGGEKMTESELTHVWMREIPERLINDYVSTGETQGKAGAFAIQGKGAIFVERIEGDFFNVVGLPLFRLSLMLEQFGINILSLYK